MAVVRFSEELKDSIIHNAKMLFKERLNAATAALPPVGDEIVESVLAPFMERIEALPEAFLYGASDKLSLMSIGSTKYDLAFKLNKSYPIPRSWVETPDGSRFDSGFGMIVKLADVPAYAGIKQQLDDYKAHILDVENQQIAFVAGVKKVIDAYSTLAPALKAWPPLWDLVPEEAKARHRKVVERVKEDKSSLDVDLTKLTSTVVASKLVK